MNFHHRESTRADAGAFSHHASGLLLAAVVVACQVPSDPVVGTRHSTATISRPTEAETQEPAAAVSAAPSYIGLSASFNDSVHSEREAFAPYAAGGNVILSSGFGRHGGYLSFHGNQDRPDSAALIYDGRNVSARSGTLSFEIRWSGNRNWGDDRRTWLATLVPRVGERGLLTNEQGTSLAIVKDETNHLALALHQFHDKRLSPEYKPTTNGSPSLENPDSWPIRIPVGDLESTDWTRIELGWNHDQQRVWLGVAGNRREAPATLRPTVFRALILGSPPRTRWESPMSFDGDLDELLVLHTSPAEESIPIGLQQRKMAGPPKPNLADHTQAKAADSFDRRLEFTARRHLQEIIASQKSGGWAYEVAIPSGMRFLDRHTLIPYSDRFVGSSKAANSAWIGLILLAAYDVLGDDAYLAAARATADVLLAAQLPAGHFPPMFLVDDDGVVRVRHRPDIAPIEDHVQTHPILLLWRLARVTSDERYTQAADRAFQLLLDAQNQTGSWPHHFRIEKRIGSSVSGEFGAGEISDYATTDAMRLMLLAHRRSGDPRLLGRYLAAADWLRDAFIDGPAKGWAAQYDARNRPIPARHFEPAAISLTEGAAAVPIELHRAAGLTGYSSYQTPVSKFATWLNETKIKSGWMPYYEPTTGRAIKMTKRKITTASANDARDFGMTRMLREVKKETGLKAKGPAADPALRIRHNLAAERDLLNRIDEESGLWVNSGGPTGKLFSPSSNRILSLLRGLSARNELAGQRDSRDHLRGLAHDEWLDPFSHLLSARDLYQRITPSEIARARALWAIDRRNIRAREGSSPRSTSNEASRP